MQNDTPKKINSRKPIISIITPVYEGEFFIEACMRSVIDQKCLDVEHVIIDGGSTATFDSSELFATQQEYNMLNWKNIDFSNMVDIEWIVDKSATQNGSPYHFEFSGSIIDFYQLAHFLPYTGEYKIRCNIIDGFNVRSTAIRNKSIVVAP